jgi:CDP-diacylglycerol--serine O-phosphatidyltransferase
LVIATSSSDFIVSSLVNPYVWIGISFLSAYLLNAEIPLFSLKIKNFTVAKYKIQLIFVVLTILLLVFFHIAGIPLVILTYVLLSVIHNKMNRITV